MPRKYASMQERILANSRVNSAHVLDGVPCRDWTGSVFPHRCHGLDVPQPREECYGRIAVRFKRGPRRGKVKSTQAHRESQKAFKKNLRVGSKNVVQHMCNRPICIEPKHLIGGIQKTNVRKCVKDGRHKTPFRRKNGERYTAEHAS